MADKQKSQNSVVANENNNQADKEINTDKRSDSNNTHDEKQSDIQSSYRIETKKKIIFGAVFFISIIIIVGAMAANFFVSNSLAQKVATADSAMADSAYQSSLLSNGLAIIAIAISVWAGLNIVNAIERKDIDKYNNLVEESIKNSEEVHQRLENIKNINADISNTLFFFFLNELMKTINDESTAFLYQKYSSASNSEKAKLEPFLLKMTIIEQLFVQVYQHHTSKQVDNKKIIELSRNSIRIIDEILEDHKANIDYLSVYFKYRKAEFFFYSGYATTNKADKYLFFMNAAEIYCEIANKFNAFIPSYEKYLGSLIKEDIAELPPYNGEEKNRKISMYFLNSIGESYSRIILELKKDEHIDLGNNKVIPSKEIILIGEKSKFYLSCCNSWLNPAEKIEVYYRNLGCLLERLDIIKGESYKSYKDIINCYKKAFYAIVDDNNNTMYYRVGSVYHVLIQYLFKYVNFKLGLTEKDYYVSFNSEIKIPQKDMEEACTYMKELFVLFQFAQTEIPRKRLHYSVEGLLYTIVISCKKHKICEIEKACKYDLDICIENVKHVYEALSFTNPPETDNYYNELKKRLCILNIINEGDNKKENV